MNWKKIAFGALNIVLGVYLVLAMTAFNKPDAGRVCKDIRINIEKSVVEGFLSEADIRFMLNHDAISPIGLSMEKINLRQIEETLQSKELIEDVQCYKGQNGLVCIDVRQRIPVVRVMNDQGEDFYVDNHGKPMPSTDYSCNLIIATGHINKQYAERRLVPMANIILSKPFWKSQVVQLNVLGDGSVEIVPRVGGHIAYIGQPDGVEKKLDRLQKFYRYGLMQAGWNKYSRVSVEFDNQIVCKRK